MPKSAKERVISMVGAWEQRLITTQGKADELSEKMGRLVQLQQESETVNHSLEHTAAVHREWRKFQLDLILAQFCQGWCSSCKEIVESPNFTLLAKSRVYMYRNAESGDSLQEDFCIVSLCSQCVEQVVVSNQIGSSSQMGVVYTACRRKVTPSGRILYEYSRREQWDEAISSDRGWCYWDAKHVLEPLYYGGYEQFESLWALHCSPEGVPGEQMFLIPS